MPMFIICHGNRVCKLAEKNGWHAGARYTNTRDVRGIKKVTFVDIDWENYCFKSHLRTVMQLRPLLTVARDIVNLKKLDLILTEAEILSKYCKKVILVPKDKKMAKIVEHLPDQYLLGYSVPTRYGSTSIDPKYFADRKVHLLGGRPSKQRDLANDLNVYSLDCNSFTIDASFGKYFNGSKYVLSPELDYYQRIKKSMHGLKKMWVGYRGQDLTNETSSR
jgi:hypothetical protein